MHTITARSSATAGLWQSLVAAAKPVRARGRLFAMALAVFAALLAPLPLFGDPIFDAGNGHALFTDLLRAASWGMSDFERAAFIIRSGDGSLHCETWPATNFKHAESFHGEMPPGTIAIVHTHPVDWPLPSPQDAALARRLGVPVYVLTMRSVYKALPDSPWPYTVVRGRLWFKDHIEPLRCADLQ